MERSEEAFLSIKDVVKRVSLCRATIYKEIKAGRFPPGYMLTPGRRGWRKSEIDQWFETRSVQHTEVVD